VFEAASSGAFQGIADNFGGAQPVHLPDTALVKRQRDNEEKYTTVMEGDLISYDGGKPSADASGNTNTR
jgi:hypothetical protein